MRGREPIVPQRRRRIPAQFSWVDHRLVREGHIQGRSAAALALYLFLVTVADADGLSWYSEAALCRGLACPSAQLQAARTELEQAGLIAYRQPLYQVLDLAPVTIRAAHPDQARSHRVEAVSVGQVLQNILAGGAR
jgi:hypothetical protein